MINFIPGSPTTALRMMTRYGVAHCTGQITSPHSMNRVNDLGLPWIMDNGCYKPGYDPDAIQKMLVRNQGLAGCKFGVVPDVVCDHTATLALFNQWSEVYQGFGYPLAFVLQNGITSPDEVPWNSIAAVFIGGDDRFHFSSLVRQIVNEAKKRCKWVHMGRVNTLNRIVYANSIGCDSTDGTGFALFHDNYRFAPAFNQIQLRLLE